MPDSALKFQNNSMRIQKELANIMIKGMENKHFRKSNIPHHFPDQTSSSDWGVTHY